MVLQALTKGWNGELKSRCVQTLFLDPKQYHVFNDVIIQLADRSTQIDHILVSKYGLFVVETKNRSGWIYGSADDERWTQVLYGQNYQFQNPLRQNYMHTKSLAHFLRIDHKKIHSLVVFWGKCQFKTRVPENVLIHEYTGYVKSKKEVLLTNDEVDRICYELQRVKDSTPFLADLSHVRSLKQRYESTTVCPKCGGNLLERTSHAKRPGQRFIGCENYPRCRYTRELESTGRCLFNQAQ
jgi:hypothetical protein